LDTWVFEKVELLLAKSKEDPVLQQKMKQHKIVFFLHLLGLDTNGHARRPMSQEYYSSILSFYSNHSYLKDIELVDRGIERLHKLFEEHFPDKSTAYLFTSDHGMSNKGSHGDGEKANTETPFVAWGAGVSKPIQRKDAFSHPTPEEWALDHLTRVDILQADIAPFMVSSRFYWRFYRNIVVADDHRQLQYCDRISNRTLSFVHIYIYSSFRLH
jgi:phosphatidylinositol glycan class N